MGENQIHFSDHLEQEIAALLERAGIDFIHESQGAALDFYLPGYDVYIEVKQFYSDRAIRQLANYDNVILIQGRKSLGLLALRVE